RKTRSSTNRYFHINRGFYGASKFKNVFIYKNVFWGCSRIPADDVYYHLREYGAAQRYRRKNKPYYRNYRVVGKTNTINAGKNYRHHSGRRYPIYDMGNLGRTSHAFGASDFRNRCESAPKGTTHSSIGNSRCRSSSTHYGYCKIAFSGTGHLFPYLFCGWIFSLQ